MNNYYEKKVFWSSEDDCYVVEVPELPGCMAHGSTEADASANADISIRLWVKAATEAGRTIPVPNNILAIIEHTVCFVK